MKRFKYVMFLMFISMFLDKAYSHPEYPDTPPVCKDFLAQLAKTHAALEFQSCTIAKSDQGKPMTAHYQVAGEKAAEVERFLIDTFDMPSLKFFCCGWEAVEREPNFKLEGSYIDPKTNFHYSISMISEETLINDRTNWAEIPYFHVRVATYTDTSDI